MLFLYRDFVNIFRAHGRDSDGITECLRFCEEKTGKMFKDDEWIIANKSFRNLAKNFTRYWTSVGVNRCWDKLESKHGSWLQRQLNISISKNLPTVEISHAGPGRKAVTFQESSNRTQRRKVDNLVANVEKDTTLLLQSARKVANLNKEKEMSKILTNVMNAPDPKNALKALEKPIIKMNASEALALYIDSDMTRDSYQKLRNSSLLHNADIYPSYHTILEEKKLCYPEGLLK